jgi:hypothetical protein
MYLWSDRDTDLYLVICVSLCIFTIQQYLLQQMHNFILFSVKLAYMFRPNRPLSVYLTNCILGIPSDCWPDDDLLGRNT